jgi:uncharacterized protein (DUF1778 family)
MIKTNRIFLRTDDATKSLIKEQAKARGLGISEYLRKLALKDAINPNNN